MDVIYIYIQTDIPSSSVFVAPISKNSISAYNIRYNFILKSFPTRYDLESKIASYQHFLELIRNKYEASGCLSIFESFINRPWIIAIIPSKLVLSQGTQSICLGMYTKCNFGKEMLFFKNKQEISKFYFSLKTKPTFYVSGEREGFVIISKGGVRMRCFSFSYKNRNHSRERLKIGNYFAYNLFYAILKNSIWKTVTYS